jgi:hypothetical protein
LNIEGGEIKLDKPENVIMKWSDDNICYSKYSPARFNRAIWLDFVHR